MDPIDGRIYGVSSNAKDVICLSPRLGEDENPTGYEAFLIQLPPSVAEGKFKWLRGIIHENYLYGIPAWSNAGVLRVHLDELWGRANQSIGNYNDDILSHGAVSILPLPKNVSNGRETDEERIEKDEHIPTRWLWHGAALNKEKTAIYCIPSNAHQVLKIDLITSSTSFLKIPAFSTPITQTNKWYGGILGADGAIYGVPYAASGVIVSDQCHMYLNCMQIHSFFLEWHSSKSELIQKRMRLKYLVNMELRNTIGMVEYLAKVMGPSIASPPSK